ncbi:hypothetical protein BC829DRAFT_491527 [Chytridium lagenaria]|nr:hypothetical protein BC829DRAFT_491527 [Chytridium lagenaria]
MDRRIGIENGDIHATDEPQACYCGEPICKGVIGGEKKADLLGYDDEDEDVETTEYIDSSRSVKAVKRSSMDSDDEDYKGPTNSRDERGLESEESVQKLVKSMFIPYQKVAVFRNCSGVFSLHPLRRFKENFFQYHGLPVLKSFLMHFMKSDANVCHETLKTLVSLPISSRNSIVDHQIEEVVMKLTDHPQFYVENTAKELLSQWSQLPTVYRIPKRANSENSGDPDRREALTKGPKRRGSARNLMFLTNLYPLSQILYKANRQTLSAWEASGKSNESAVFFPRAPSRRTDDSKSWPNRTPSTNSAPNSLSSPRVEGLAELPLPKSWRTAQAEGKTYYYNVITRKTQWEFPAERTSSEDIRTLSSIVEGVSEAEIEAIVKQAQAAAVNNAAGNQSASGGVEELRRNCVNICKGSEVVVKTLSKYKSEMDPEKFKKLARKITHQILEKEAKKQPIPTSVSEEMKAKIKKFAKAAIEKAGIKPAVEKIKSEDKSHPGDLGQH